MIEQGSKAPDFTLPNDQGGEVSLSDLGGRTVVLYFYPKDDTPGCTVQACDFRDNLPDFDGLDAVVLGVSADSIESHRAFREKHALNFPLLSDESHEMLEAYDVWKSHSVYGMTIERSTFLIDGDGTVRKAWRGVDPKGHADMLKNVLDEMNSSD
ncbi:MAG: peroxiredoxin [Gemmatimonadota bacterium]